MTESTADKMAWLKDFAIDGDDIDKAVALKDAREAAVSEATTEENLAYIREKRRQYARDASRRKRARGLKLVQIWCTDAERDALRETLRGMRR